MNDLIRDAQQSMRIRVLPQGMEFKNYVPVIRTITKEGSTPGNEKISKELKSFMDKLQDEFSRTYGQEIKDDSERVPKAEYEFYITGLSNGLELRQDGELPPLKSYALQVPCVVGSKFKKVRVQDMNIDTEYKGSGEGSVKKGTRFSPSSLSPGACTKFTCPLEFPRNWSFSTKDYQGALDVVIRGNMAIDIEVPGQTPDAAKKKLTYTYPFIQKRLSIPLSGTLPPAPEFLALVIGGSLAFLGFLGFFIYKNALPISITLSTEGKARAYQVSNGQAITVGGTADFEMEGMDEVVAAVKREGRQFVVIPQKEGVFADGTRQGTPVPLKFGQGFNLNIEGTYYSVQLLEGDQEASLQVEEQIPQDVITTGEEGEGKFNF